MKEAAVKMVNYKNQVSCISACVIEFPLEIKASGLFEASKLATVALWGQFTLGKFWTRIFGPMALLLNVASTRYRFRVLKAWSFEAHLSNYLPFYASIPLQKLLLFLDTLSLLNLRMRRTHSTRHHVRPSMVLPTDDLGVLREGEESTEDTLRKQLLEREREVDRVCRRISDCWCEFDPFSLTVAKVNYTDVTRPACSTPAPWGGSRPPTRVQEPRTNFAGYTEGEREMYGWFGEVRLGDPTFLIFDTFQAKSARENARARVDQVGGWTLAG